MYLLEVNKAYSTLTPFHDYELTCKCELLLVEKQNKYLNEIHHVVADHVALW